jgi:hypothetical protein
MEYKPEGDGYLYMVTPDGTIKVLVAASIGVLLPVPVAHCCPSFSAAGPATGPHRNT